jgi:hypothetical protein
LGETVSSRQLLRVKSQPKNPGEAQSILDSGSIIAGIDEDIRSKESLMAEHQIRFDDGDAVADGL